jgi:TolB-like protein
MASIFLSYSSEDRACAEILACALEEAGHRVWWDRQIVSGYEFGPEIEAALETADLVLVAWSKHSAKSPWVRDEAAIGRDSGRLFPVVIDGSKPPIGFRQFQVLDLSGWKRRDGDARTTELVDRVDARLSGKSPALRPASKRPGWLGNRRMWMAAAALVFATAAVAAVLILRLGGAKDEPASLAVLPFKNMSAGEPYFAEGVAEEISDELSREPEFKVVGRTSASLFKDAADLRDVGKRLHVAYVLEGSVRSAGDQVRVEVSLVETGKGVRLWSQDFNGSLDDMFAIQDRIGQQVALHVRRQLVPTVAGSALKTSGEVYRLYATARSLMREREPAKIKSSVDLLERAVKLDANYAPAWARLALAQQLYNFYSDQDPGDEARTRQIRYAEHAIALAPKLGDAHAVLGLLLSARMDAEDNRRARRELETAVKLEPGNSEAWYWLSILRDSDLDFAGELEALRRAATLDPFFVFSRNFADLAWDMGYREESRRFLNDQIANQPDPYFTALARANLAYLNNDRSGAYEYAKTARLIRTGNTRFAAEGWMGAVLLELQMFHEAERTYVSPFVVDMRRGKFTFPNGLRGEFPRAQDFWAFMDGEPHMLPALLVKLGRSGEMVAFYDEAFSSPDDMAARFGRLAFVEDAPMLAISLQRASRVREGSRILLLADDMCRNTLAHDHQPRSFRASCSRVWAVLGRKELAIATLEQAVADGWRPSSGEYAMVRDQPAYAVLRDDLRLIRIDAMLAAEISRERRKLQAAGI